MASEVQMKENDISDDSDTSFISPSGEADDETHYALDGGILAERLNDGQMQYLVKWEGFDESFNTWEPEENFDAGDTLKEWREKKMRITRNLTPPFDLFAFERRVEVIRAAIAESRHRKKEKNRQLGIPVSDSSASEDTDDEDGQDDQADHTPTAPTDRPASDGSGQHEEHSGETAAHTRSGYAASKVWTDQERRAIEAGLIRANGPDWDRVIGWYGVTGSINQDLKSKNKSDLQRMALVIKKEFISAGREPPSWLQQVRKYDFRNSKRQVGTAQSLVESNIDRPGNLSDMPHQSPGDPVTEDPPVRNTTPPAPGIPIKYQGTARPTPGGHGVKSPTIPHAGGSTTILVQRTHRAPESSISAMAVRATVPGETPEARSPTKKRPPGEPNQDNTLDPRRQIRPTPVSKPLPSKSTKSRGGGQEIDAPDSPRLFKTLAAAHHQNKRRRIEPAPDLESLVFLDPRTGKKSKTPTLPQVADDSTAPAKLVQEDSDMQDVGTESGHQPVQNTIQNPQSPEPDTSKKGPSSTQPTRDPRIRKPPEEESLFLPDTASPTSGSLSRLSEGTKVATQQLAPSTTGDSPNTVPSGGNRTEDSHSAVLDTDFAPPQPLDKVLRSPESSNVLAAIPQPQSVPRADERLLGTEGVHGQRSFFRHRAVPSHAAMDALYQYYVRNRSVIGHLKLGDGERDLPKVRLQEFDRNVQQLLLTIKTSAYDCHFDLKKKCSAAEYQAFFPADPSEYFASGCVVAMPGSKSRIIDLADELANGLSGAIFFARAFTMIVYPVDATVWDFLDRHLQEVPEGAILRFAVRNPLPTGWAQGDSSSITQWMKNHPSELASLAKQVPSGAKKSNLDTVFRDLYDIEFNRLVTPQAPTFFLFFMPTGGDAGLSEAAKEYRKLQVSEEHDLIYDYLRANGAEVYSMHDRGSTKPANRGSWLHFVEKVHSGVILVHYHCNRLDGIPWLFRCLYRSINVWRVSLHPTDPMPDGPVPLSILPKFRHQHLVRLFPHGGVILITASLILYEPHEALRVLRWLRLHLAATKTLGTWKIALRPRVRPWLLSVMDLYDEHTASNVFSYRRGHVSKQIWADIYAEITLLLLSPIDPSALRKSSKVASVPRTSMRTTYFDQGTPSDDALLVAPAGLVTIQNRCEWTGTTAEGKTVGEALPSSPGTLRGLEPRGIVRLDHDAIRQNDDQLITWFSEWAAVIGCYSHRKFSAILSPPPPPPPPLLFATKVPEKSNPATHDSQTDHDSPTIAGSQDPTQNQNQSQNPTPNQDQNQNQDQEQEQTIIFTTRLKHLSRKYGHVAFMNMETAVRRNGIHDLEHLKGLEMARKARRYVMD